MRIVLVHGNDGSDVRVGKLCRSLSRLGHEVHFVGWDRRPAVNKELRLGGAVAHVMPLETNHGRWTARAQVRYSLHVRRWLVQLRPEIVCAVNEDNALRVLPWRGRLYKRLVCDVFDSHRDRASAVAAPLRWLVNSAVEMAWTWADTLIATDETRYERFGRHRHKTVVIGNYPEDPGPELAQRLPQGKIRIYVAGTLTATRGLEQILKAVEQTQDAEILAAGWTNDRFSEQFIRHPQVVYEGVVDAQRSLALAAQCDAVFAFYAPTNRNNLLASPNKVYDAMSVGRPVLINSEAIVARWVVEKGVGMSCPYFEVNALQQVVASLKSRREWLSSFAARVRELFQSGYTWQRMESRLAEIYGTAHPDASLRSLAA